MLFSAGYDGLPVEELQGMGIGSHPGSTYGQVQDMDMGGHQGDLGHFDTDMPQPPQDNNQVGFNSLNHSPSRNLNSSLVSLNFQPNLLLFPITKNN